MLLLAIAGTLLRVGCARGELWGDELWSLELVGALTSPGQVFWGLAHDNNHALNSLWLFFAGPDAPPLWLRAPAVTCGGASIVLAALVGGRAGRAAGLSAAALMAFGYPFVDYGSEARGYAGLILAVLGALWCLEPLWAAARVSVADAARSRFAWGLAGAVAFGTLSHLTMLLAVAAMGAATLVVLWPLERRFGRALDGAVTLFRPTLLLLLPVGLLIGSGIVLQGGLTMGGTVPFTLSGFLAGFGGLLGLVIGLPQGSVPPALVLAGVAAAAFLAYRKGRLTGPEGALAATNLGLVPALMALARLPNTEQPRYYLPFAVVMTVLAARVAGRAFTAGRAGAAGGARWAGAALVLGAVLAAQAWPASALLTLGRGQAGAMLAAIELGATAPSYATNFEKPVSLALDHAAALAGRQPPALVSARDPVRFCAGPPPPWFVQDLDGPDPAPARLAAGPPDCRVGYALRLDAPVAPLSGRHLALYRLTGGSVPPAPRTSPR